MTATDVSTVTLLRKTALEGVRAMLTLAGEDPDRPGLAETPRRVVDALLDMTSRPGDPAALLARVFDDGADEHGQGQGRGQGLVVVGPIRFDSLCEHHLLPFTGRAWIGYLPEGGRVVGLSKLPRLVDHYARRVQMQERLTSQIADAIDAHLAPRGVGVRVVGVHSCMTVRGVRKPGAEMTTMALRGAMSEPAARAEFVAATQ